MWIPPRQRRGFLSHCGLKFLKNKNKKRDNRRKVNINSNTWALKWMLGYRTVFCCRERFYPLIRNQAGSSSNNGRDADFFMQNVWFYRKCSSKVGHGFERAKSHVENIYTPVKRVIKTTCGFLIVSVVFGCYRIVFCCSEESPIGALQLCCWRTYCTHS